MAEPLSNGQAQSLGAPSLGGSAEPLLPPAPSPVKNIEAAEMKAQPNSDEGVAGVASEVGVLGAPEEVKQSGNGPNEVQATVHTREADTGAEADAKREEAEEILIPLEVNTVQVPLHWHPKPCVHVTSIGGQMKEEELLTLFSTLGQVSSISFENERQDAAIVRYESSVEADAMVTKVRDALNNTKLGDRTLIVEPFRPDSFLFIGNLTSDIDDALLRKMFEPHGKIERAFVLYNAEGRSKGYGFVEFSLKGQATSAKMAMGNINMDGRVLRVEWSDCRKIADMFSTVLFIDRLPRDNPNVEQSLRSLFGQYGKVRDCHLAIGINQQFRGFGFVDFCHSLFADKAHQALDGHELEGSNIRVSFANPSKSAQSYKMRFGTQAAQAALGLIGRGAFGDHILQPLVPGMLMGPSLRGNMAMPLLASRLMGSARPGMLGMGIGMQFGRGTLERGLVPPLLGGGTGMLGPGSVAVGMMGRSPLMVGNSAPRAGSAVRGNLLQAGGRLSTGQGALPITSAAIAQVATAQAKAREEEAKARAEAAKQAYLKQAASEQQVAQQSFYQQQTSAGTDQQYKQTDSLYSYQQTYQQPAQQQTTLQSPYQAWSQQQQAGQDQQTYNSQYYSQPTQTYAQQQQATQYSQHDGYYQQSSQQSQVAGTQQQFGYAQQYGQQYSQQYGQQYSQQPPQSYGQTYGQTVQSSGQQYQQATPQQSQTPYMQQNYSEQYVQQQQQQPQEQSQTGVQSTTGTAAGALVQDSSQQGAVQAGTVTSTATVSTTASAEQSYEAQWAAYYASQAAYQQASYGQQAYTGTTGTAAPYYEQTSSTDVGQKRTADQMEPASQNQAGYNYPQVASTGSGYSQQAVTVSTPFQQPSAATATAYQQTAASLGYQQPGTTLSYQQPGSGTSMYQQPGATGSSGYEQATSVADGYQQQPATGTFQATAQGQTAVAGMYDYNNKRPRF